MGDDGGGAKRGTARELAERILRKTPGSASSRAVSSPAGAAVASYILDDDMRALSAQMDALERQLAETSVSASEGAPKPSLVAGNSERPLRATGSPSSNARSSSTATHQQHQSPEAAKRRSPVAKANAPPAATRVGSPTDAAAATAAADEPVEKEACLLCSQPVDAGCECRWRSRRKA